MFKRRKKQKEPDTGAVKINVDTDYRFVSPFDAKGIDLSEISHESNLKLLNESQPDDRVPNYRDPLINAHLKKYAKYLERHKITANRQWEEIKTGAKAQAEKCVAEIDYIDSLNIDDFFEEEIL